jgi:hypothetical protein
MFLVFFLSLLFGFGRSENNACRVSVQTERQVKLTSLAVKDQKPNILVQLIRKKLRHTKRVMATLLAFPLPFGILALHRIYLGTKPFVPVVYMGTIGGVFGILPFIDFCVLLLDRDIERFNNNGKVFMWIN